MKNHLKDSDVIDRILDAANQSGIELGDSLSTIPWFCVAWLIIVDSDLAPSLVTFYDGQEDHVEVPHFVRAILASTTFDSVLAGSTSAYENSGRVGTGDLAVGNAIFDALTAAINEFLEFEGFDSFSVELQLRECRSSVPCHADKRLRDHSWRQPAPAGARQYVC